MGVSSEPRRARTRNEPPGARGEAARKPEWLRVRLTETPGFVETRAQLRASRLHTVCEEAACPNRGECWAQRHATVMILGRRLHARLLVLQREDGASRRGRRGRARAARRRDRQLGLRHVVITSVDRDDLDDGGAAHFVACIEALRRRPSVGTIEVLTPDFRHKPGADRNGRRGAPRRLQPQPGDGAAAVSRSAARRELSPLARRAGARESRSRPAPSPSPGSWSGSASARTKCSPCSTTCARPTSISSRSGNTSSRPRATSRSRAGSTRRSSIATPKRRAQKGFLLASASPLTRSSYHADADFERLRSARGV